MATALVGRLQAEAAAQAGLEECGIPAPGFPRAGGKGLPDGIAAQGLNRNHPGFAAPAPLGQALHALKRVDIVAIDAADADAD